MSTSALDLISSSLRLIGVLSAAEVATANEQNDCLITLNQMIDSWGNERLMIYTPTQETFPLVAGQQTYTMGTGGNFNTARPLKIENARILQNNGGQTVEFPVGVVNKDQWADIIVKTVSTVLPTALYMDGNFPLQNINLWPIPASAAYSLILYSWKPLIQFATLQTVVSLPPGYAKALRYNLAVDLAPEFGRQIDPEVLAIAVSAKAGIKRANTQPQYMQMDQALLNRDKPFNWYSGE